MGDNEENYEKCNNLDCGSGYFHKKNAAHINCSEEKCNPSVDKIICCDKEDKTLKTIGTIITVFSILTLAIIIGLGFYKMSRGSAASIYSRFYIVNLIIKLLTTIFYIIPLDGIFVLLINKILNKNWSSLREMANLNKWGIYSEWANSSVLITTILFFFAGGGFWVSLTKEIVWLKNILIGVMVVLASIIIAIIGRDKMNEKNPFPDTGTQNDKRSWLFYETGKYLKYIIGSGIALAVLSIVLYLFANNILFTVGGSQILMAFLSLGLMGLIYYLIKSNKKANDTLKKNKTIGNLFYIFFIIPCLFHDIIRYLYNEFRYTPNVVYGVFLIEIVVIALYVVLPMIQKKMYANVSVDEEKSNLVKINIQNLENEIYILKKQKQKIISEFSMAGISKNNLKKIKDDGMDSNEEELKHFLLNLDFKKEEIIDKSENKSSVRLDSAVSMVQKKTNILRGIEAELDNKEVELERLKEIKNQTNVSAGVLLREPICLRKETKLYKITEDTVDLYTKYNYNYAISGWFFIRANKGFKNEYRTILNYNNRPKISYNSYTNKIKIEMLKEGGKEFISDDIPLQKWFNVVINYDSGVLDIFIDSKFVSSINNLLPKDMSPAELIVGGGDVRGGVCNIVHYPNSISKERIELNYNLLKSKNPPIV